MDNEQIVKLIQEGQNVQENLGTLYEQNRGLIAMAARRAAPAADMDDKMQQAFLILMDAARMYQPQKGARFTTYLSQCVFYGLMRDSGDVGPAVDLPVHTADMIVKYKKFAADFAMNYGREPGEAVARSVLGLSESQFRNLTKAMMPPAALDGPARGFDDVTLSDTLPDDSNAIDSATDALSAQQDAAVIWAAVDDLEQTQAAAIRGKYHDGQTLAECAEAQGISVERVRQKQQAGFRRLRNNKSLRRIAEQRGYGAGVYHGGLQRFRHTGYSSPEWEVIKKLEGF